jgi:hypothetical protein
MEHSHGLNKKSHVVLDALGPTVESWFCHPSAQIFQEAGRPVAADASLRPPFQGDLQHFVEVAARRWPLARQSAGKRCSRIKLL